MASGGSRLIVLSCGCGADLVGMKKVTRANGWLNDWFGVCLGKFGGEEVHSLLLTC
jgi:hypothetical protein